MKTTKNYLKSLAKAAVFTAALSVILTACTKDHDNYPVIQPAGVAFIHASVNAPELSIYSNGGKAGIAGFSYNKSTLYLTAQPGTSEIAITKTDSRDVIAKLNVKFKTTKGYTMFVVDSLQTSVLKFVEDDLTAPVADKAKIRFVNLSADAGSLDFGVKGQTTPLFTKQDFKQVPAFISVDPNDAYTFEIKANGTATVLATSDVIKVEKGKIYTIYARGLKANAATPYNLGISAFVNK